MNFNRINSRISSHYIADPYNTLLHYKRTFGFLKALRERGNISVLCLGNKNQVGIKWDNLFKGENIPTSKFDERVITSASSYYDLIICYDLPLHGAKLRLCSLPIVGISTPQEINQYPEILEVIDYLIPVPSSRIEAAIKHIIQKDLLAP